MQSAAVTAAVVPFEPSRRVKVHSSLSGETSYLSTICGLTTLFSSIANRVS